MFEELQKDHVLRDLLAEMLRGGALSISQLAKRLKEQHNLDMHRLTLAGYLKALADVGVLDEREVPPAKTYSLKPAQTGRTLYDVVARRVRDAALPEGPATHLFVQVLYDLFHRPIFREELRRAGFDSVGGLRETTPEQRQSARRLFSRSPIKLPFNDPAYAPPALGGDEERRLKDQARGVLASVLRQEFRVAALAETSKQATLGGE